MPQKTNIGWCDFTSNPLKYLDADGKAVWACVKKSPGCLNCYSEALAKRWGRGADFTAENMARVQPYLDEKEIGLILRNPALTGKSVFMCDMTDWAADWVPMERIERLTEIMQRRSTVTFYTLTKRICRLLEMERRLALSPNIYIGTSIENQDQFERRWKYLRQFSEAGWNTMISFEPLLGEIQLPPDFGSLEKKPWCIIGGESGAGFRPVSNEAIGNLAVQCHDVHGCRTFFKQVSSRFPGEQSGIVALDSLKETPFRIDAPAEGAKQ